MGGGVVFKVRSTQIRTKVLAPIFWRNLKVRPREVDPLLSKLKVRPREVDPLLENIIA